MVTLDNGINMPSTKLLLCEVLVEEVPELNTTGKLSESNINEFLLFKLFLKIYS